VPFHTVAALSGPHPEVDLEVGTASDNPQPGAGRHGCQGMVEENVTPSIEAERPQI
jgi:hypothetical protein